MDPISLIFRAIANGILAGQARNTGANPNAPANSNNSTTGNSTTTQPNANTAQPANTTSTNPSSTTVPTANRSTNGRDEFVSRGDPMADMPLITEFQLKAQALLKQEQLYIQLAGQKLKNKIQATETFIQSVS